MYSAYNGRAVNGINCLVVTNCDFFPNSNIVLNYRCVMCFPASCTHVSVYLFLSLSCVCPFVSTTFPFDKVLMDFLNTFACALVLD